MIEAISLYYKNNFVIPSVIGLKDIAYKLFATMNQKYFWNENSMICSLESLDR